MLLRVDRSRTPELITGIVAVIIGAAYLVSYLIPSLDRFVVLAIGIGILALFAATRAPAALIGGSIVTGVGTGIVLASYVAGTTGGALFLISLGGGFLLAWLVGWSLEMPEARVWPLIPGSILVLLGAAMLPGAGWAVALIVIGLGLVVVGFGAGRRSPAAGPSSPEPAPAAAWPPGGPGDGATQPGAAEPWATELGAVEPSVAAPAAAVPGSSDQPEG